MAIIPLLFNIPMEVVSASSVTILVTTSSDHLQSATIKEMEALGPMRCMSSSMQTKKQILLQERKADIDKATKLF